MKRTLVIFAIVVALFMMVSCDEGFEFTEGITVSKNFDSIGTKDSGAVVAEPVTGLRIFSYSLFQTMLNSHEDFRLSKSFNPNEVSAKDMTLLYVGDEEYVKNKTWFDNWNLGINYILVIPQTVTDIYQEATGQLFPSLASSYSFYWYMYTYYGFKNPAKAADWSSIVEFFASKEKVATPELKHFKNEWIVENPVVLERISYKNNPIDNFNLDSNNRIQVPDTLAYYYESQAGKCLYSTVFLWAMDAYFGLNETQVEKMIKDGSYISFIEGIKNSGDFNGKLPSEEPVAKKYKDRVVSDTNEMPGFELAAMSDMLVSVTYSPDTLIKQGSAGDKITDNTKIYQGGEKYPSGAYYELTIYYPKALAEYVATNFSQEKNINTQIIAFLRTLNRPDLNAVLTHNSMTDLTTSDFGRVIRNYSFDFIGETKTVKYGNEVIWTSGTPG